MSHETQLTDPARVVLRRRIEWMDTDAAGIYHWTTVFRLAEAAEAALHTALGIVDLTFGATPRVAPGRRGGGLGGGRGGARARRRLAGAGRQAAGGGDDPGGRARRERVG